MTLRLLYTAVLTVVAGLTFGAAPALAAPGHLSDLGAKALNLKTTLTQLTPTAGTSQTELLILASDRRGHRGHRGGGHRGHRGGRHRGHRGGGHRGHRGERRGHRRGYWRGPRAGHRGGEIRPWRRHARRGRLHRGRFHHRFWGHGRTFGFWFGYPLYLYNYPGYDCRRVTVYDYWGRRYALIGGTLCYDELGYPYLRRRWFIRFVDGAYDDDYYYGDSDYYDDYDDYYGGRRY